MINLLHTSLKKIYIYTLQHYTYVHIALIKKIIYNHITVYYIGLAADPDDCNTHYKLAYIETDGIQLSENICLPRIK